MQLMLQLRLDCLRTLLAASSGLSVGRSSGYRAKKLIERTSVASFHSYRPGIVSDAQLLIKRPSVGTSKKKEDNFEIKRRKNLESLMSKNKDKNKRKPDKKMTVDAKNMKSVDTKYKISNVNDNKYTNNKYTNNKYTKSTDLLVDSSTKFNKDEDVLKLNKISESNSFHNKDDYKEFDLEYLEDNKTPSSNQNININDVEESPDVDGTQNNDIKETVLSPENKVKSIKLKQTRIMKMQVLIDSATKEQPTTLNTYNDFNTAKQMDAKVRKVYVINNSNSNGISSSFSTDAPISDTKLTTNRNNIEHESMNMITDVQEDMLKCIVNKSKDVIKSHIDKNKDTYKYTNDKIKNTCPKNNKKKKKSKRNGESDGDNSLNKRISNQKGGSKVLEYDEKQLRKMQTSEFNQKELRESKDAIRRKNDISSLLIPDTYLRNVAKHLRYVHSMDLRRLPQLDYKRVIIESIICGDDLTLSYLLNGLRQFSRKHVFAIFTRKVSTAVSRFLLVHRHKSSATDTVSFDLLLELSEKDIIFLSITSWNHLLLIASREGSESDVKRITRLLAIKRGILTYNIPYIRCLCAIRGNRKNSPKLLKSFYNSRYSYMPKTLTAKELIDDYEKRGETKSELTKREDYAEALAKYDKDDDSVFYYNLNIDATKFADIDEDGFPYNIDYKKLDQQINELLNNIPRNDILKDFEKILSLFAVALYDAIRNEDVNLCKELIKLAQELSMPPNEKIYDLIVLYQSTLLLSYSGACQIVSRKNAAGYPTTCVNYAVLMRCLMMNVPNYHDEFRRIVREIKIRKIKLNRQCYIQLLKFCLNTNEYTDYFINLSNLIRGRFPLKGTPSILSGRALLDSNFSPMEIYEIISDEKNFEDTWFNNIMTDSNKTPEHEFSYKHFVENSYNNFNVNSNHKDDDITDFYQDFNYIEKDNSEIEVEELGTLTISHKMTPEYVFVTMSSLILSGLIQLNEPSAALKYLIGFKKMCSRNKMIKSQKMSKTIYLLENDIHKMSGFHENVFKKF